MENALCKLTDSLSYSKSRDAIASKKGLGISNVLISINHEHPKQKNILFQSSNICFAFVFCIEYSARHRHMQSLIYLYAFPVFSCCKHVYFLPNAALNM